MHVQHLRQTEHLAENGHGSYDVALGADHGVAPFAPDFFVPH